MASANPPVKGAAFAFETALIAQADTDIFKTGPTLVAGDVRVVQDGVLLGNITTLPTAVTNCTNLITVSLSAAEMNADRIAVLFHDAAGDEWQDQEIMIFTSAQTFDTSDGIVDDIKATVNSVTYGNSALATAIGAVPTAGEIDTQLSGTHGVGAWGQGVGVFSKIYTVTVDGLPRSGAYCRLCTDLAGANSVSAGTTNSLGQVTFWHNLPTGTNVWVHVSLDGYEPLIDPETI